LTPSTTSRRVIGSTERRMMTAERVRQIAEPYFRGHDLGALAPDVISLDVPTGREVQGREAVAEGMLADFWGRAFEGGGERSRTAYAADGTAVMEFDYTGRHVGTFHGIGATGRTVTAKVCIVASVGDTHIEREHLYYPLARILEQLRP
jgi:hypothetical protein